MQDSVVFGVQVGGLFAGFGLVPEVFLGVQTAVGVELARGGLERVLGEVLAFGGWGFGRVGLAVFEIYHGERHIFGEIAKSKIKTG